MGGIEVAVAGLAMAGPLSLQARQTAVEEAHRAAQPFDPLFEAIVDDHQDGEHGRGDEHPQDGRSLLRESNPDDGQRGGHGGQARVPQQALPRREGDDGAAPFVTQFPVGRLGVFGHGHPHSLSECPATWVRRASRYHEDAADWATPGGAAVWRER